MQNIQRAENGAVPHDVGDDGVVAGADLAGGEGMSPEDGHGEHEAGDGESVEAQHCDEVGESRVWEYLGSVFLVAVNL